MSLRNKLKMKVSLRAQIEKEQAGGRRERDNRILNYFEMKNEQKMTLLLLPDVNGTLWTKYKVHGPNLRVHGKNLPGVGSVACIHHQDGTSCPACQRGFDYLNLERETGDKAYREEAKRWFGKDTTLMSVLVLDSPIEIPEAADGNAVKLMYVPYKVEQMIVNHIAEGIIDEDEIFSTPFVLKKTENQGGMAAYDTSYFERKSLTDEDVDAIAEGLTIDLYDYNNLDIIPRVDSVKEVEDWLAKAEEAYEKALGGVSESPKVEKVAEAQPVSTSTGSSVAERLAARRNAAPVEEDESEGESTMFTEEEVSESEAVAEEQAPTQSSGSSIRDRLARIRK